VCPCRKSEIKKKKKKKEEEERKIEPKV